MESIMASFVKCARKDRPSGLSLLNSRARSVYQYSYTGFLSKLAPGEINLSLPSSDGHLFTFNIAFRFI